MILFSVLLLIAAGVALLAARRTMASLQAGLAGGRIGTGCVVAEAVVLFAIAAVIFLARKSLE